MTTFTRSITFNDLTATISFPTKLNISNQLDWTMTLTSGINKVSTTGTVALQPSTHKTTNATNTTTGPVTYLFGVVTPVDEDKVKHVTFIKESLETIDTTSSRDAKAACAKMLYDYLFIWGMDFIKAHERFKQTVIAKAYELKSQAPEKTTMIDSMNKVLTALDQPLEKPSTLPPSGLTRQVAGSGPIIYCECTGCPDLTIKNTEMKTEPSNTLSQISTAEKETPYNPDLALFIVLAKKHAINQVINNPTIYLSYYEKYIKRGWFKGVTKAERMNSYLTSLSDRAEREKLMKSLFTKNNLVFSDLVMTLYDEWQKTYKPTGVLTRYKKIYSFIDAHKTLFTTA